MSLSKSIYDLYFASRHNTILVVGLENVGKTTIVEEIKCQFIPNYAKRTSIYKTVGMNASKIVYNKLCLTLYDFGGSSDLQFIWQSYYQDAAAIIYVCDIDFSQNNSIIFDNLVQDDRLRAKPLLILFNKLDLKTQLMSVHSELGSKGYTRLDSNDSTLSFNSVLDLTVDNLGNRPVFVSYVSAISGENIKQSISWLFKTLENK